MDENKRKLLPRRKQDMKESIYKTMALSLLGVGVSALIYMADSFKNTENMVRNIESIVHSERVVVGVHGQRLDGHDKMFDGQNKRDEGQDERISRVESKVDNQALNAARFWRKK